MSNRHPIANINIGQVDDQRYSESEVHHDRLGNLAGFFGRNMPVHRHDLSSPSRTAMGMYPPYANSLQGGLEWVFRGRDCTFHRLRQLSHSSDVPNLVSWIKWHRLYS